MGNNISIVTMFFDIGRGDWSIENGIADFANRNNDKYFAYFANLAKLENDMVVFTTPNFKDRILELRQDRPTQFVMVDLDKEYGEYIAQISKIQNDPNFYNQLPNELRKNPEYRSPTYVLINNLKTHFVNQAIKGGLTKHKQIAWVDFGYCRDEHTLGDITEWRYAFDPQFMHFFTIKRPNYFGVIKNPRFASTLDDAYHAIFHNKVYIIGSIFIGTSELWHKFGKALGDVQHALLAENIIDDDQGVYVMTYVKNPNLFELHFLGKGHFDKANWFSLFKIYHQ
ncbi:MULTISPECIES: WlaTC/HtrL family glycosyltransferase [unclassified Moraxella]|uniref:WlaTC/HtrL family glycosyltransferase n=1 Tax=unclassified Moraxella TaxID=2685852 RepID=UPI003AF890F8